MNTQANSFSYIDSIAGKQNETFGKLSEIVKYIEDFGFHGDFEQSTGVVYKNDNPILSYVSNKDSFEWIAFGE